MLILLVGLAFLIVSFSSYSLAYQINGINRIVTSTPISIFESCILHDVNEENHEMLFNKDMVKEKLEHYFSYELSKFTDKFSYDIYFYNKEDESMCIKDECNAVEVSFYAELAFNYNYERVLNYEVLDNSYGS